MAWMTLYRQILCLRYLQLRQFHKSSRLRKKQYEYDLDSLVKWKQETKLLFGPQQKLTKTGKLKKRKKETANQVTENVEVLSSMSNRYADDSFVGINENPSWLKLSNGHSSASNQYALGDEQVIPHKKKKVSSKQDSTTERKPKKSKTKKAELKNVTDFGPDPEHNLDPCLSSTQIVDTSLSFEASGTGSFSFGDDREAEISNIPKSHVSKRGIDALDIPKIEPVPSCKDNNVPKKSLMPAMTHFPTETPQSFEIVSSFPLKPQGFKGDAETRQLHLFKMDVEKMALRFLPSVKTVLNKTMPDLNRFFLNRWREGMINELGEKGFQDYKNETIRQGINLHANVMEFLSGKQESELQIMPENEGHWASLHLALQSVSDIQALEMDVLHPALHYRGVFDCVARYKDLLCVIDWKVSKKPRPLLKNTYDDPLQVAAYIGAVNATDHFVGQHGEINHGLIVVAYPDGSPAHMHLMNRTQVEQYWQEWTARLHSFFTLTYTEKFAQKRQTGVFGKT